METQRNVLYKVSIALLLVVFLVATPQNAAAYQSGSDDFVPQTREEMILYLLGMIAQLQALIDLQGDYESSDSNDVGVVRRSSSRDIEVDTLSASDIRDDEADLRGRIDLEDERYATVWFEYGESKYDLDDSTRKRKFYDSDGEVRTFSANVDDLDEDEKYYYQAVAKDRDGDIAYGSIKSFTTDDDNGGSNSGSRSGSNDGFELSISDRSIDEGDSIEVDWEVPDGDESSSNWIGLYERGDSNKEHRQYRYIANDVEGTVKFTISDEGEYEFRLFLDNSFDDEVESPRFDVDE